MGATIPTPSLLEYAHAIDHRDETVNMTATTAKRPKAHRTSSDATPKSTAYGRDLLRVLREMQKLGPWEFGPRVSSRIFKK